jgi:hypothetical protein
LSEVTVLKFLGRNAVQLENETLRVTLLADGCHIAEIFHKQAAISPLWIPPWLTANIEQDAETAEAYGPDRHFLASVMGHHVCLDMFGEPSESERSAGFELHGEASLVSYDCFVADGKIHATAHLERSALRLSRSIHLGADGYSVSICETVENLLPIDRPIAWTQHVTLGPPFLVPGVTRIRMNPIRSRVANTNPEQGELNSGADFTWPNAPSHDEGTRNLSIFADRNRGASLTTHRMESNVSDVGFTVFCPLRNMIFGYRWNSQDFPWLVMWEENKSRHDIPWSHETVACGLEFGVSPFPESRREMVDRGSLFDTSTFRWLGAKTKVSASYSAFLYSADQTNLDYRSEIPT